jgi:hypothetical protein
MYIHHKLEVLTIIITTSTSTSTSISIAWRTHTWRCRIIREELMGTKMWWVFIFCQHTEGRDATGTGLGAGTVPVGGKLEIL